MNDEARRILHKWDKATDSDDEFEEARQGCARIACGLLERLVEFPEGMQADLVLIIALLARKAMLTGEEKTALFGKNMIVDGLAERILADRCVDAILLAALEWADEERFSQAAALLADIKKEEWPELAYEWERQWRTCHNPDAALICLLACRYGEARFEQKEMEAMEQVVREQWTGIDALFNLMAGEM